MKSGPVEYALVIGSVAEPVVIPGPVVMALVVVVIPEPVGMALLPVVIAELALIVMFVVVVMFEVVLLGGDGSRDTGATGDGGA